MAKESTKRIDTLEVVSKDYLQSTISTSFYVPYREENTVCSQRNNELDKPTPSVLSPHEHASQGKLSDSEGESVLPDSEGDMPTTRSGQRIRRTQRLEESEMLRRLHSFVAIMCHKVAVLGRRDNNSLNERCRFFTFPASCTDEDTIYLSEAMRQKDKSNFLKAMCWNKVS